MIISEKQILQLMEIARLYSREIKLTQLELSEPIDNLILKIIEQQSQELKVIE